MVSQVKEHAAIPEESYEPYVVRWHDLVSTTNWEKGRIICQWRESLSDGIEQDYTDQAWADRVGGVSPQHVGRLRRVHLRFGEVYEDYEGLYWSHFQAAMDWNDAEMWLEGAIQNEWSVSQMRSQRWEALGKPKGQKPRDEDVVTSEFDEDAPRDNEVARNKSGAKGPNLDEGPDFGDEASGKSRARAKDEPADEAGQRLYADESTIQPVRPFEDLPELPADLNEAMEMFKLSILRHKMDGWSEVSPDDVLDVLDALKQLIVAPAE